MARPSIHCKSKLQPTPCVRQLLLASVRAMASSMIYWFVFVIFTSQTTASHFRGGIITWKPDEYIGNKVIDVNAEFSGAVRNISDPVCNRIDSIWWPPSTTPSSF